MINVSLCLFRLNFCLAAVYVASVSAATFLVKEILWSHTLTSTYNFSLRLDRYVFTLHNAYDV